MLVNGNIITLIKLLYYIYCKKNTRGSYSLKNPNTNLLARTQYEEQK